MSKSRSSPLFLGIEGGGTRTVAILSDAAEHLEQRVETGPANLKLLNDLQLTRHLKALARKFPGPAAAVCIGLAGLRTDADRARVLAIASKVWPGVPCRACSDLDTALAAAPLCPATRASAQVLVLSGTGSCCYARAPGVRTAKVDGWGHLLGDKGSAYAIGLETLKEVVQHFDRTGDWPPLGQAILRALQLNHPDALITWVQSAQKTDIAALALEVFEAWGRRDQIASRILSRSAQTLAEDAAACARRLVAKDAVVQFTFTGSVLLKQPRFFKLVSKQLAALWPTAEITALAAEGAWGAVRLAKKEWTRSRSDLGGECATGEFTQDQPTVVASQPRLEMPSAVKPHRPEIFIPKATALSPTERRNPRSMRLDQLPVTEAIALMLSEEEKVPSALLGQVHRIQRCIQCVVQAFRRGGRLFYVGAGTSGRLGALDASECPPTFRVSPDQVQGIMAGGQQALWQSLEGAEDDAAAGADAIQFRGIQRADVVVGIAASGRTPFVWGALEEARRRGARTILLSFNPCVKIPREHRPHIVVAVDLGPEVLTGSTRLKAGTATKLFLNVLTTVSMVRMGKVISNLMVDLNPSNQKLRQRAIRIVRELTGAGEPEAAKALENSGWIIKNALRRLSPGKRV